MDWFLYDNGLRHERVKNTYGELLLSVYNLPLSLRHSRVHISEQTYEFVKNDYEFEDGKGGERNSYLQENNIITYLVIGKRKFETKGVLKEKVVSLVDF